MPPVDMDKGGSKYKVTVRTEGLCSLARKEELTKSLPVVLLEQFCHSRHSSTAKLLKKEEGKEVSYPNTAAFCLSAPSTSFEVQRESAQLRRKGNF